MKNGLLLIIVASVLLSCGNSKKEEAQQKVELKGRITISGAFALYPLAVKWGEEFSKVYPDIKVDISAGGAGKGMTDVLSDMVDIAMVSREISPEEVKKGAWFLAVAQDAVLPVMNIKNKQYDLLIKRGLKKEEFETLFFKETKSWKKVTGADLKVNVYTRSDACGAAEMWAAFCGYKQEDFKGVGVFGDPGMAEAVLNDENGVGFNNLIYLYDIKSGLPNAGLSAIPIDLDKNGRIDSTENFYSNVELFKTAIKEGKYPMPPARNLYFVSKGEPTNPLVKLFLKWVLNEGKAFIDEAGYIVLPQEINKGKTEILDK